MRYKSASESAEKIEDELKVERRKLQREVSWSNTESLFPLNFVGLSQIFMRVVFSLQLRTALDRIDELEVSNSHLSKRLEKMKANRNALLAQQ